MNKFVEPYPSGFDEHSPQIRFAGASNMAHANLIGAKGYVKTLLMHVNANKKGLA